MSRGRECCGNWRCRCRWSPAPWPEPSHVIPSSTTSPKRNVKEKKKHSSVISVVDPDPSLIRIPNKDPDPHN